MNIFSNTKITLICPAFFLSDFYFIFYFLLLCNLYVHIESEATKCGTFCKDFHRIRTRIIHKVLQMLCLFNVNFIIDFA